jgi:hypothetical protein
MSRRYDKTTALEGHVAPVAKLEEAVTIDKDTESKRNDQQ